MPFDSLKYILSKRAAADPRLKDLEIARIFDISQKVLRGFWGAERAAFIRPISFKEGQLKLESSSPAAQQQFKTEELRIRNEINRQLGRLSVRTTMVVSKGF
ncbi:DUF721 domain-containing protein [Candidatus Uhrbacteria bacterium]|nr:DUF721 domain-containing protein [Candidatus Uhrbacteria bacterium]